jgi:uncharacterized membrane protein YeaQ/YmgE (transglycosylase-associated protein family)
MGILSWVILGLIAGFIGSKIVDRQWQGFWLDIALGIVGRWSVDSCSICSGHRVLQASTFTADLSQ